MSRAGRSSSQQALPAFDPYLTLGVSRDATGEMIDVAWRRLAKQWHPDVAGEVAGGAERIRRLNVAHDWLKDPDLRATYHAERGVKNAIDAARERTGTRTSQPTFETPMQTLAALLDRARRLTGAEVSDLAAASERRDPRRLDRTRADVAARYAAVAASPSERAQRAWVLADAVRRAGTAAGTRAAAAGPAVRSKCAAAAADAARAVVARSLLDADEFDTLFRPWAAVVGEPAVRPALQPTSRGGVPARPAQPHRSPFRAILTKAFGFHR